MENDDWKILLNISETLRNIDANTSRVARDLRLLSPEPTGNELDQLKYISARLEGIETRLESIRTGAVGSAIGRGEWMILAVLLGLILWRVW